MNTLTLWTVSELAARINMKESWIRSQVFRGTIPFLKVGRLIRFSPEAIDLWLMSAESNKGVTNVCI